MEEVIEETLPAVREKTPKPKRIWPPAEREKLGPVSPDVLQTILLDEIAGRLEDLGELIKALGSLTLKMEQQMEKIPEGRMRPFEKSITGNTVEMWEVIDDVGRKCNSATVYNDGPNEVYICLNDIRDGFQEIKEGESLDFSFKHPVIERFFFKSTSDGTANLRIPLEY